MDIDEAKALVQSVIAGEAEEIDCPCCGQHVAIRRQNMTGKLAAWLIALIRIWDQAGRVWIKKSEDKVLDRFRGGDYAKLEYWGLIERHPSKAGLWRPTRNGVDYAKNRSVLPPTAISYDDTVYRYEGDPVRISAAFKNKPQRYERAIKARLLPSFWDVIESDEEDDSDTENLTRIDS